ncbi:hypothetical protein JCM3774_003828 [Rhodotorula dairenensis]
MSTASSPELNELVWLSVKPLIRILIPAATGFALIKRGVFPPDGTRSASLLILNFLLPCLLFSKIVPSFTSENVHAIGPIILAAFFYQALPGAIGLLVRACTQTPRRFRYGILAAYMFGNWGDLPTSVVQSVMASAPFNGEEDETLGIAFVSIFILVNYISSFPLQGLRLVQVDYECPIDAETELRHEDGEYGTVRKYWSRLVRGRPMPHELEEERQRQLRVEEDELDGAKAKEAVAESKVRPASGRAGRPRMVTAATQTRTSADREDAILLAAPGLQPGHALTDFPLLEPVPSNFGAHSTASHTQSQTRRAAGAQPVEAETSTLTSYHPRASVRVLRSIWGLLRPILTSPPTMVLVSALIISLVPTLRALFVAPDAGASFHPTAPDGKPPLAVLYDTATFVGGASVPTGLIVLGASIAKIKVPRPISRLPLSGILGMAVVRMAIMPIVGFFFVKQLVRIGMVEADNKVLRFVMVLFSCVPTATQQMTYQLVFAPPGQESNADLLAAYLLMQYVIWAFSSVLLTAFSLHSLDF